MFPPCCTWRRPETLPYPWHTTTSCLRAWPNLRAHARNALSGLLSLSICFQRNTLALGLRPSRNAQRLFPRLLRSRRPLSLTPGLTLGRPNRVWMPKKEYLEKLAAQKTAAAYQAKPSPLPAAANLPLAKTLSFHLAPSSPPPERDANEEIPEAKVTYPPLSPFWRFRNLRMAFIDRNRPG